MGWGVKGRERDHFLAVYVCMHLYMYSIRVKIISQNMYHDYSVANSSITYMISDLRYFCF